MALLSELFIQSLDKEQGTAQYIQLYRVIERCIAKSQLKEGAKLPSSRDLSALLKVSRNTVKSAYELLQAEGYIQTRQGAGSYVCAKIEPLTSVAIEENTELNNSREMVFSQLMTRLNWQQHNGSNFSNGLLAPSTPALSEFPWMKWQKAVNDAGRVMKHEVISSDQGHISLREQIASYLGVVRGVRCEAKNILVFSGSQQGIYLALQLLVDPQQAVFVETPSYVGIDGAINAIGARKIAVEADEEGFNLPQDDSIAKVAVVTPSRNYPLGYSLSLHRRQMLIQWAQKNDGWILEDDYDSEFRFDGPPLTALQGLQKASRVIYSGTFSKILHPSIRIGYLVLPDPLVEPFCIAKKLTQGAVSVLPQLALAKFMQSGSFASHVRKMRKLYKARKILLTSLVAQNLPDELTLIKSDGGMHCVYLLEHSYSDVKLCASARKQGLSLMPLSSYYSSQEQGKNGLVLGFAGYDEPSLIKAVAALRDVFLAYKD